MEAPKPEILLPGRSSSPTPAVTTPNVNGGPGPVVCALCLSAPGKYTCPRCNGPYCSVACYKGSRHSACSELFYRESVLQALQEEDAGCGLGRKQMEDMLQKLREEEEEPLCGSDAVINEEESDLWNSLSRQEKEHFSQLLESGHIGSLVPEWRPWWDTHQLPQSQGHKIMELPEAEPCHGAPLSTYGHQDTKQQTSQTGHGGDNQVPEQVRSPDKTEDVQKVNERKAKNAALIDGVCGHDGTSSSDRSSADTDIRQKEEERGDLSLDVKSIVSEIPPLLGSIPPLCSLTRQPSPLVRFTLVNVIYSYAFSLLRHNGDVSDPDIMMDFIGTLLSVSGGLRTTTVYNSTAHALKSAVRAASDPLLGGDEGVALLAMEATAKILVGDGGKRYSLAAISHLYQLLGKIRKLVTQEKDVKKDAFNAKKKCLFLASWVNENGESLGLLSAEVKMEHRQYLKDLNVMSELSKGLERVWGGKRPPAKKKLIQEVN